MDLTIVSSFLLLSFIIEGLGISSLVIFSLNILSRTKCVFQIQMFLLIYGHISVAWGIFWLGTSLLIVRIGIDEITRHYRIYFIFCIFCFLTLTYIIVGATVSGIITFSICPSPKDLSAIVTAIFGIYGSMLIIGVILAFSWIVSRCLHIDAARQILEEEM
jgi:hypothetical protein